jgi:hypothetical protein
MAEPAQAYVETAAMLAVLEGDEGKVHALLADMSWREREELARAADRLGEYARRWCQRCGGPIADGVPIAFSPQIGDHGMAHAYECPRG